MMTASNVRSTGNFLDLCDRLLAGGHAVRFRAEGWSMYPAIRDGELVDVVAIEIHEIRRGDVLLCRLGHGTVAHRVRRMIQTASSISAVVLRGDAAFACDPPVAAHAVLGRVVATTRNGVRRRLDTRTARIGGSLLASAWRLKRAIATRL